MSRLSDLEKLITAANKSYYNGVSAISDAQYDAWKDELKTLDPNHSLLKTVGAAVDDSPWVKHSHSIPMASLDKVNTEEEFNKWASGKSKTGFIIQEKMDGLSLSIDYRDGAMVAATTRGDGTRGEDVSRNARKM